ncbi:MAG: hypothetical protein IPL55_07985 [Saprospiraceae bacterium]|nr:hypothetical protein [Saprospiraceae bacterium]
MWHNRRTALQRIPHRTMGETHHRRRLGTDRWWGVPHIAVDPLKNDIL